MYPLYYPVVYSNNNTQPCIIAYTQESAYLGIVSLRRESLMEYSVVCVSENTKFSNTYRYSELSTLFQEKVDSYKRELEIFKREVAERSALFFNSFTNLS